jgi:serine/threonine protein kinase
LKLRRGTRLGKYRLGKRLGEGAYGVVFEAQDMVERMKVALKIVEENLAGPRAFRDFANEVRFMSSFEHPNIVQFKNADIYNGYLAIATELGVGNLLDLARGNRSVASYTHVFMQIVEALAHLHQNRVIHRDIKPENIVLFPHGVVKLADLGLGRVVEGSMSGTTDGGTMGYWAPEQAFGRPCPGSDVFSMGLVMYETLTGHLPRWPFERPFPGHQKFVRRAPRPLREIVYRAVTVDRRQRYHDAVELREDMKRFREKVQARKEKRARPSRSRRLSWEEYRRQDFLERYGEKLELNYRCYRCNGPISEYMDYCPWCGYDRNSFYGVSSFPYICSRCERGIHGEWTYCPWCWGGKYENVDAWVNPDDRYVARCPNSDCPEGIVMRYMRYCPWCHRKLKPWSHPSFPGRCPSCNWFTAKSYWDFCAWCGYELFQDRIYSQGRRRGGTGTNRRNR